MATHWSSYEVPKGARIMSGASTILTLAVRKENEVEKLISIF